MTDTSAVERALEHVGTLAVGPSIDRSLRVTVHFHPDRLVGGRTVLERLAADGRYRSQFETGISNGGLTAHPAGDRWSWEHRMFGGAYDAAPAALRPIYGSLNHRRRAAGGSIRFGSAHLRLAESTLDRTTFCYPDSVFEPTDVGTAARFALTELADQGRRDFLDDYVEAQVHGPVRLAEDVEALVLDPSFLDTDIAQLAALLPVPVEWHHGFLLDLDELSRHADYRGQHVVDLGQQIAVDDWIDARVIGIAASSAMHPLQSLKQLWHCTARYGRPARTAD